MFLCAFFGFPKNRLSSLATDNFFTESTPFVEFFTDNVL